MCGEAVCLISAIEAGLVILNVFGTRFYHRRVGRSARTILENYLLRTSNSVPVYHPQSLRPALCLNLEVIDVLLSQRGGKI